MDTIRIGIVGLGANTREKHVPGLLACENVELAAVCNRRPESTRKAAAEFDIPRACDHWEDVVNDQHVDAIVIGTWPYLHAPIAIAALGAGKHVMSEARMAANLAEARQMLAASRRHPSLVAQIVPSPFGLRVDPTVREYLADGFIGELREVVVLGTNNSLADASAPFHWRQSAGYSGINMLALGILHETLIRWVPDPVRVQAQTHIFARRRKDQLTGELHEVGTPDSVHVLTELPGGARGLYHLSGVLHHGPGMRIDLYGSEGTLRYHIAPQERLLGARKDGPLEEIHIPREKAGCWRVEADFIDAIRGAGKITLTDFETGVRYMEFTEAVHQSARDGAAVNLPLDD